MPFGQHLIDVTALPAIKARVRGNTPSTHVGVPDEKHPSNCDPVLCFPRRRNFVDLNLPALKELAADHRRRFYRKPIRIWLIR
jgi:hypothetical protein